MEFDLAPTSSRMSVKFIMKDLSLHVYKSVGLFSLPFSSNLFLLCFTRLSVYEGLEIVKGLKIDPSQQIV